jgi:tRNA modification GTPase
MNKILSCLIKHGARLAEPGEFTKRAFLNGRIDLVQADSVMDLISAKNDFALKSSLRQLGGAVSESIKALRADILHQIAYIEAALDDPEHYDLESYHGILSGKITTIIKHLEHLLKSADQGKILKDGINTVIIGKPNVGKSSFLNLLLGEERAIVTEIAGTTRDILSESVMAGGVMLNIIDTAGIRDTADTIEKLGVERSLKSAAEADLIIFILDASVDIDENDLYISKLLSGRNVIILLNKIDLALPSLAIGAVNNPLLDNIVDNIYPHVDNLGDNSFIIKTSIKEKIGITEFEGAIQNLFLHKVIDNEEEIYITNLRHIEALNKAYESLRQAAWSLNKKMPEDLLTVDMMAAYEHLGRIIGEQVDDDLIDEIFHQFCLGK